MATQTIPLGEVLDRLVVEGTLYEKLENNAVRCYACGHRCLIKDGREGICRVRYNVGGTLYVPHGYVGALQVDPTEKKPFFHILPGSETLTFGMLGCDLHCSYCFTGTTRVPTTRGMVALESLFARAMRVQRNHDGEIAFVDDVQVFSHTGQTRPVRAVFRHAYSGDMLTLVPAFCPPIECTPDHKFLAVARPKRGSPLGKPEFIPAQDLSPEYCLAMPKSFASRNMMLDTADWLALLATSSRMKRQWPEEFLKDVLGLYQSGYTSGEIALRMNESRSRVAPIVEKVRSGQTAPEELLRYGGVVLIEGSHVRVFNEHTPGIPQRVALDESLAELLGYYCAEGCVWHDVKRRANATMLTFSFGRHEEHLANRVAQLLADLFGVQAQIKRRATTCAVVTYKLSLGLLFAALCGSDARTKRVPPPLFEANSKVAAAFLKAYAAGDGSQTPNGMIDAATVSLDLAYGAAWLALKSGAVPFLRSYQNPRDGRIDGRAIHRSKEHHRVRWYPLNAKRRCWEDEAFYFIPIRKVDRHSFSGFVYNLEVQEDHTYLPNFVVASNCQNWQVSQTLRDPTAGVQPQRVTPEELVHIGRRYGAKLFGSSYNEPLITSEWAVDVFKAANQAGFRCVYISNGNATPEVLDYIRPHVVGYKIDLKSMNDKNYRKLGADMNRVLDGVKMVHERGFWLEIVTLTIPGFNDSNEELWDAARFIASISPDIPWHVTAFHKDYKMTDPDNTDAKTLLRAAEIGQEAGLRYVYAGNLPGQVGPHENTYCPNCGQLLIERWGYRILNDVLSGSGQCPKCGASIPGIWS